MKLKEIYSKEIERKINPAVVAQDRTTETIDIEIGEYVFTDEIINNLYKVLLAIKNKELVSKTGIWINGYYGSGKSHFIKILSYLLGNQKAVNDGQTKAAIEFFKEKISEAEEKYNQPVVQNRCGLSAGSCDRAVI